MNRIIRRSGGRSRLVPFKGHVMPRLFKKQSHKVGLPPGTVAPPEEGGPVACKITVTEYREDEFRTKEQAELDESIQRIDSPLVTWINVSGLVPEVIETLGQAVGLHQLTLEDIHNSDHRPKFEEFDDYIFITLKIIRPAEEGESLKSEQISLVVGKNYVLSFQESSVGLFAPIRGRLEKSSGRIRSRGADYLAYALLDTIIDNYYFIIEDKDRIIEELEDELAGEPGEDILERIYFQRREMMLLRRYIWPLRDVIQPFQDCQSELVDRVTRTFVRDLKDHVLSIIDTVDNFREMLTSIHDNYRLIVSERMNQIMKVLTIIATIFIPLTFVAGVYGMNFQFMPELKMWWGYPASLGLMAVVAGVMTWYFKKNKWF